MCPERTSFYVDILDSMKATNVDSIVSALAGWALHHEDTRAMALIGSWARGDAHQASDVDLLLLSDCAHEYRRCQKWITEIDFDSAGYRVASWEDASYGLVWSCHIGLLPPGKVELTFAPRSWARTDTVDVGTRRVVKDAFRIIFDKDEMLAKLVAIVMSE
jgi:uncharacterized protein